MKMPYTKPGSTRAPMPAGTPRLGDMIGRSVRMGKAFGNSGPNARLLHPDQVALRARRGQPPYREPVIGEADPSANEGY